MGLKENIDAVVNWLIIQYHDRPKAKKTIAATADLLFSDGILEAVQQGFNVNTLIGSQSALLGQVEALQALGYPHTEAMRENIKNMYQLPLAVGKQLDILGSYVGVARTYVYDGDAFELNDEEFRTLIQLKSANNSNDHSYKNLFAQCFNFFADELLPVEWRPMKMTYVLSRQIFSINLFRAARYWDALIRPLCVWLPFWVDRPTTTYFSFTDYDWTPEWDLTLQGQWGCGFSSYENFDEFEGEFFAYENIHEF